MNEVAYHDRNDNGPCKQGNEACSCIDENASRIFRLLDNGAEIGAIVADRQMRRAVNDLWRLGWVNSRGSRH